MKIYWRIVLLMLVAIGFAVIVANAQFGFPKEIALSNGGKIIIYQPQPENLDGNILTARAAASIAKTPNDDLSFGAIWFVANLQINNTTNTATISSLTIKQAKFPSIQDQQFLLQFAQTIQSDAPNWNAQFPLDNLQTALKTTKQQTQPTLNNDAPHIVYKDKPTTLVIIDGTPKLQLDNTLKIQKVINTPSTIVLNPDDNLYYLYGGGIWYISSNILNGWSSVNTLPTRIQQIEAQILEQQQKKSNTYNSSNKPSTPTDILVSTEPIELIQTEGTPTYQTVAGTSLLYVDNSLNDIFKDINSQDNYILISGRWYASPNLSGGWQYVPADKLPEDFAKIPEGTEKDGVLSSVAGTNAANQALMDAQIPQTAKVDRKTATTNVTYDGNPVFNPIQGTHLMVAENSNITVLKTNNGSYYAVDNGIWFISNAPNGPWQVATDRPADVDNIPADNMAYNTKYVYVYNYTPDYVYAGYTPGYLGCYSYGPTVVWGTGWYYRPWYHHFYYPRPYTWGFGMCYNPWSGWNIGYPMGYSLGWDYYDYNPYCSGWFGPRNYRPAYRHWGFNGGYYGRREGLIAHPNININRPTYINKNTTTTINQAGFANPIHRGNIYNKAPQGVKSIDIDRNQTAIYSTTPRKNSEQINPELSHPRGDSKIFSSGNGWNGNQNTNGGGGFNNQQSTNPNYDRPHINKGNNTNNANVNPYAQPNTNNSIDPQLSHPKGPTRVFGNDNNIPQPSSNQPINNTRGNIFKSENNDWKKNNEVRPQQAQNNIESNRPQPSRQPIFKNATPPMQQAPPPARSQPAQQQPHSNGGGKGWHK